VELIYWNILISTVADLSDALPLIFLLRKVGERYLKVLRAYFIGSFVVKFITIVLIFGFNVRNTLAFYHFLSLFEFICLFLYFSGMIGVKFKHVLLPFSLVLLFNIVNSIWLQGFNEFNSHAWGVNTTVLLFMGLLYLYKLYSDFEDIAIEKHFGFIVCAAFMIYFGGSLFTYLLGWKILSQVPTGFFANGWIIQSIANVVKNVIIVYGVYQRGID
jgi:hypothetical protein